MDTKTESKILHWKPQQKFVFSPFVNVNILRNWIVKNIKHLTYKTRCLTLRLTQQNLTGPIFRRVRKIAKIDS
jgi:hypothetical protein